MTQAHEDEGKKVYIFRSSFWDFYLLYWNQNCLFSPLHLDLLEALMR